LLGNIPNSRPVDAERWSCILSRVRAAGICIDEQGTEDDRLYWFGGYRGNGHLGFGVSKEGPDYDLSYWCSLKYCWRTPFATRKLAREVVAIVESVLREPGS
jgi:hypothetical protein